MKKPDTDEELRDFCKLLIKNPQRCLAIVEQWLADDPQDVSALYDRHSVWLELGEPQKALADLDTVIARDPNNPWNFLSRGNLHRRTGDFAQALQDYDRGEAMDPEEWQSHAIGLFFQADCHARVGNESAALSYCSRLPDDFWTPGLFGAPHGGPDEIADQLKEIAYTARRPKHSQ